MRELLRAIAEHKLHCTANTCCLDELHDLLTKEIDDRSQEPRTGSIQRGEVL